MLTEEPDRLVCAIPACGWKEAEPQASPFPAPAAAPEGTAGAAPWAGAGGAT